MYYVEFLHNPQAYSVHAANKPAAVAAVAAATGLPAFTGKAFTTRQRTAQMYGQFVISL